MLLLIVTILVVANNQMTNLFFNLLFDHVFKDLVYEELELFTNLNEVTHINFMDN